MPSERAIDNFDLEPIKYKLVMDRQWSCSYADKVESLYKQFLILMIRHPQQTIVPLGDIDVFWHQHILDTRMYAEDCAAAFGRFVHHYPYFGLRGDDDAKNLETATARTSDLFLSEFNVKIVEETTCGPACSGGTCGPQHCSEGAVQMQGQRPRFEPSVSP